MRRWAMVALLVGACSEDNPNYTGGDVSGRADGAQPGGRDLAALRDLAVIPDLTFFPDLAIDTGPSSDVAENVLATWDVGESADDNIVPCNPMKAGTVMLAADSQSVKVGQQSVRVDYGPNASSYFQAVYPRTRDAAWDLRTRTGVDLFVDGVQAVGFLGWQPNAPVIVLCSANGYRRFDPQANPLPATPGKWVELNVPLAGSMSWSRIDMGQFDLGKVSSIEVHADPYRNNAPGSCSMWIDGLRFY